MIKFFFTKCTLLIFYDYFYAYVDDILADKFTRVDYMFADKIIFFI